jgi:glutathione S-transferase
MIAYPLTTLAILVALLVYFGLTAVVGQARAKYNCPAPASGGHPEFDKRYRVQMNTLEQLALFLPAVWLAAPVLGDAIAAGLAALWSLGRIVYARSYYADPTTRSAGFMLTLLPTLVLIIAAGYGAVASLIG